MMKRFDDRMTDFHTGKKVSPDMKDRKICACCGQRIVKGWIIEIGHVGDDCEDIIKRRKSDKTCFNSNALEFIEKWQKTCGKMKPAIKKTIEEFYP